MNAAKLLELFDARAQRERVMLFAAAVAVVLGAWDALLMQPLRDASQSITADLQVDTDADSEAAALDDPRQAALTRASDLRLQLLELDGQITGSASGFVPSHTMVEVLQNVLEKQDRLQLLSIRNLPAQSLVTPAGAGRTQTAADAQAQPVADTGASGLAGGAPAGPYLHGIELVVEGRFADIQDYVRRLEALPWKFHWTALELEAREYPLNRVRLQLSTLSMDAAWLGV